MDIPGFAARVESMTLTDAVQLDAARKEGSGQRRLRARGHAMACLGPAGLGLAYREAGEAVYASVVRHVLDNWDRSVPLPERYHWGRILMDACTDAMLAIVAAEQLDAQQQQDLLDGWARHDPGSDAEIP